MAVIRRFAQVAMGVPFIVMGYQAASTPEKRAGAAVSLGLPEPETMVRINGVAMILGGAALALNTLPRAAAAGLAASLIPTTLAGHPFWKADDDVARATQQVHFLKNLGLIGGLVSFSAAVPHAAH